MIQRTFVWLLILSLSIFSLGIDQIGLAEEYYHDKDYDKLSDLLKKINADKLTRPQSATLSRLKGHLCLFGKGWDQYVDLSCALKNYAVGARLGDPESYFFVGFMLNNFLFNDITILKELLDYSDLENLELPQIISRIKTISENCYYLSSLGGYLPAIVAVAYRHNTTRNCTASAEYYAKASEMLPVSTNHSLFMIGVQMRYILTKADPYQDKGEELIDPEYALRTLSSIPLRTDKLGLLVTIAFHLFRTKRYSEAKSAFKKILSIQPSLAIANYYLGVISLLRLDSTASVPVNNTWELFKAKKIWEYFKIASHDYEEGENALGILSLYTYRADSDLAIAAEHFKNAAAQNSSYGAYNAFLMRVQQDGALNEENVYYLLQAAKKGHPKANYAAGMLKMIGKDFCGAVSHLKAAVNKLIWEHYYGNVYQYYLGRQKKVATIYYMIMAEIGIPIAQVNAANLLDEHEFFSRYSWLSSTAANSNTTSIFNVDKHLAFKYYKMAEEQGETVVYKRLADFYYSGFANTKDEDMYLLYLYKALTTPEISSSLLSAIAYDLGVMCQFEMIPDFEYNHTYRAYNLTKTMHSSGYVPGTIMAWIAGLWERSIWPNFWSLSMIPYAIVLVWLIVQVIFIRKRVV